MLATEASNRETPTTPATLADLSRRSPVSMIAQAGLINGVPLCRPRLFLFHKGLGDPILPDRVGRKPGDPLSTSQTQPQPLITRGPDPFQTLVESSGWTRFRTRVAFVTTEITKLLPCSPGVPPLGDILKCCFYPQTMAALFLLAERRAISGPFVRKLHVAYIFCVTYLPVVV